MKKLTALILVLGLILSLAGCGAKPAAAVDYAQVIADARNADENQYYEIISLDKEGSYTASEGASSQWDAAYTKDAADMTMQMLGLEAAQVEQLAASVSMMMTQSYCIAIAKPSGQDNGEILTAFNNFVQAQQDAQEFYLEDQYKIACDAQVYKTGSGIYVLVMAEDAQTVLNNILDAIGK